MKATGMIRQLDQLGRIVLPKELRRVFNLETKDYLEIYVEEDRIILKKYMPTCIFCQSEVNVLEYKGKNVCKKCMEELVEHI